MEFPSKKDIGEYEGIFKNYESILIGENPTKIQWALYPMYKTSQTEGILYWRIGFDGLTNELVTEHGYDITSTGKRGKLQVDRLKLYTNNLHKNIIDKALQDAIKGYDDKYKEGYSDESGISISYPGAQLANKYPIPGQKNEKGGEIKNPLKTYNFTRGIAIQGKLDGIRARIWRINGKVLILSRENNQHPWLDTYIKPELDILFNYLPQGVGLDCELYNKNITFNVLTSIIKTYKTKHPGNDSIFLYIFDLILLNTPLEKRIEILSNSFNMVNKEHPFERLKLLSHIIIYDETKIEFYHDEAVKSGFEGIIIRKLLGPVGIKLTQKQIEETWYKPGRNNNLLKVKKFIDEEGVVIDIVPGEGRESNLANLVIKDIRGNTFSVRPRGNFEEREKWLINKDKYIGKKYTIRYFELSEYGVPRFPVGVAFRDYE